MHIFFGILPKSDFSTKVQDSSTQSRQSFIVQIQRLYLVDEVLTPGLN